MRRATSIRKQGYFEDAGEFPWIAPVDLPVSDDAERHKRFGPSFIHRFLPFWVATFVERFVILVLPLIVVLVPVINYFPQFLRWRVRSRVYRWYGELALLERDVATRKGALPVEQVAAGPGSHRARRGRHPDPDQLRQRGVYAARAHRSGPPRGAGQGGAAHGRVDRGCPTGRRRGNGGRRAGIA